MSSTTPRVGFYMPADDGSEPVDVATDLNDNLEKMDSALGFIPATSGADPSGLYDGKGAYETDTGRAKFRKGGVWAYLLTSGASFLSDIWLAIGQKIGLGTTSPTAVIEAVVSNIVTSPTVLKFKQSGDTNPRMQIDVDGIKIGPGNATNDIQIYRPTANQLAITGSVSMANNLAVSGIFSAASVDISGDLDIGGAVSSNINIAGKLYGTGFNAPNVIRKTADTLRASTTTTTDDPHFTFTAEANSAYFIQLFLFYSSTTTADFKCAWTVPSGTGGLRWVLGEAPGGTDYANTTMRTSTHQPTTDVSLGGHTTGLFNGAQETCLFTTGVTAGPITFKWSQNTSDANQTGVRQGSVMIYRKVE